MKKHFVVPVALSALLGGCSMQPGKSLFAPVPSPATTPVPLGGGGTAAPAGGGTTTPIPAGGTTTTPGGSTAVPASGGTGTVISGNVTTVPNTTVTSTGLPSSTVGKTTYVGPEPGSALVLRNPYDTRAWDLRITVQGMSRDQVVTAILNAIQAGQTSVTLNGTTISGLDVQIGGSNNNWYLSGQAGTSMVRGSGNVTFTLTTLPASAQFTPAIVGVISGQTTVITWLLDQGTTSSNIGAGQSWWNGDTSNPLGTIKLWANASGALTTFSNMATGRLEP